MMYYKSIFTGQIYCVSFIPDGVGWVKVSKEEFEEWKKVRGY